MIGKKLPQSLFPQRANIALYVAFGGIVILCLALVYFYWKNLALFGPTFLSNLPFLQHQTTFSTQGWKTFNSSDNRLAILFPPNWYQSDQGYISQYPYNSNFHSTDLANAINIQTVTSQIQVSYLNADWVIRLYNTRNGDSVVNDYRPTEQNKFVKVDSGQTFQGKKFVIFYEPSNQSQLHAYLLIDTTNIYELNLTNYDQNGIAYFKQIITTASFN